MNGSGRQLEDSGGSGEGVERVLDAIEFQTAILTLNAAVEAAHAAEPRAGSSEFTGQAWNAAENIAEPTAVGGQEVIGTPLQADAFPPITGPDGPAPQTAGNRGESATDSSVLARLWQDSLERLRQSLAAASGAGPPTDTDSRRQAESARPQPAGAPEPVPSPVPVPGLRRRPQPTQFNPPNPFERGA